MIQSIATNTKTPILQKNIKINLQIYDYVKVFHTTCKIMKI